MIMNTGITVDVNSDLYNKVKTLCEGLVVEYDKDFTIRYPMQEVDTGCGKDKCNALRFRVSYRKGGRSFYDGHSYPSSYYLSVTPIELTEHGYRCMMFGGGNCTVAECNRNTAKQRSLAVAAVKNELVDIVYKAIAYYHIKLD